jgi:FkbM family methyltransferase
MTFISFAQNFEDVMLLRALRDIQEGFWIDVGAAHPRDYSVTLAFSERGWTGINIEPEPGYAALLREQRPRDVNLQVAVGARQGRPLMHHIADTGLSTFDGALAEQHTARGYKSAGLMEVEVRTLADICDEFAPADIHFLKIDAEGSEVDVLRGADFKRHRPWIVVVEATAPYSPVRDTAAFETLLLSAGYTECWFDGLNVFYLAAEQDSRLRPFFRTPPNIFDGFVRSDDPGSRARIAELERGFRDLEAAMAQARAFEPELLIAREALAACRAHLAAAEEASRREQERWASEQERWASEQERWASELASLKGSRSWRLTAPLRNLRAALRRR